MRSYASDRSFLVAYSNYSDGETDSEYFSQHNATIQRSNHLPLSSTDYRAIKRVIFDDLNGSF